jgi:hypothetical protein
VIRGSGTRPEPPPVVSSSTSNVAMSSQIILRWISSVWSARDFTVDVWMGFLTCMRVFLRIEYGIEHPQDVVQIIKERSAWHYLSHDST